VAIVTSAFLASGGHRSAGTASSLHSSRTRKPSCEGATAWIGADARVRSKRGYQQTGSGIVAMTGRQVARTTLGEMMVRLFRQRIPATLGS